MSRLKRFMLPCVFASAWVIWLPTALKAADQPAATLDQVIGQLVDHIAKHLQKHNANSVSLGAFTGNPSQGATGGAGIAEVLRRKLTEKNINVAVGSPFGLRGRFIGRKQPDNDLFAVHISVTLVDQNDEELVNYPVVVYDLTDMSKILGATASLPVKNDQPVALANPSVPVQATATPPAQSASTSQQAAIAQTTDDDKAELVARHDALAASSQKPVAKLISGDCGLPTVIVPDAKSPYAVEVLVRGPDGVFQPRPAVPVNGKPFVAIAPGETYQVRLINRSKYDAGVTLSIDGLSSFIFSDNEGYRRLDKWVVPAEGSAIVRGWHRADQGDGQTRFNEFTVTDYADTPAAEFGTADQIGTITAAFSAAWRPDEPPPPDELRKIPALRGTSQGKEVLAAVSEVRRHFGQIRATISIRYEKTEPPDLPPAEMLMAQGRR